MQPYRAAARWVARSGKETIYEFAVGAGVESPVVAIASRTTTERHSYGPPSVGMIMKLSRGSLAARIHTEYSLATRMCVRARLQHLQGVGLEWREMPGVR
jgi:hypothetical protein